MTVSFVTCNDLLRSNCVAINDMDGSIFIPLYSPYLQEIKNTPPQNLKRTHVGYPSMGCNDTWPGVRRLPTYLVVRGPATGDPATRRFAKRSSTLEALHGWGILVPSSSATVSGPLSYADMGRLSRIRLFL